MIVNGVTLPDIPAEVLEQYQYLTLVGTIGTNSQGTVSAYLLQASNSKFAVVPPGMQMLDGESYTYNTLVWTEKSGATFLYMAGMYDSWTEEASYMGSTSPVDWTMDLTEINGTVQEFDLLATNHDICIATAYDIATQTPTVGTEVYCTATAGFPPGVEPSPTRYSIAKAILDAVARQIMRLTGSSAKVKPEEFEPKLEGINIQLQELTVTATEEVQTITPPSGVYGFSKVIVEAVEDSGGTGGGGTGEGGDDSGETYVSADNMTFGYEYVEEEAPTGISYYYRADGSFYDDAPDLPADATYALLMSTSSGVALYTAPSPMTVNSGYVGVRDETGDTTKVMKYYILDDKKTGWEYVRTDYSGSASNARWANHTVTNYSDGSVYLAAGTYKQKVTVTTVAKPLERNETYTIDGNSLNSLVGLAQTITGSTEDMTPSDAITALEEYAEKLETGEV